MLSTAVKPPFVNSFIKAHLFHILFTTCYIFCTVLMIKLLTWNADTSRSTAQKVATTWKPKYSLVSSRVICVVSGVLDVKESLWWRDLWKEENKFPIQSQLKVSRINQVRVKSTHTVSAPLKIEVFDFIGKVHRLGFIKNSPDTSTLQFATPDKSKTFS